MHDSPQKRTKETVGEKKKNQTTKTNGKEFPVADSIFSWDLIVTPVQETFT